MSETVNPCEYESAAPTQGENQLALSQHENPDEPVVWPRDMNTVPVKDFDWGTDPEGLRHA